MFCNSHVSDIFLARLAVNKVETGSLDCMKLTQVLREGSTFFLAEPFVVLDSAPKSGACKSTEERKKTSENSDNDFHG